MFKIAEKYPLNTSKTIFRVSNKDKTGLPAFREYIGMEK